MKLLCLWALLGIYVALKMSGKMVRAGAHEAVDCPPWRCPCQYYTGPSILQYDPEFFPDFIRKLALRTKIATDKLLERTWRERFGNNSYHADVLIECLVMKGCLDNHMENNCLLEGLPSFADIEEWHTYELINMTFFASHVVPLVARVAIFLDQAKRDEQGVHDGKKTLVHDIERIQSDGINGILCSLARIKPESLQTLFLEKDIMSSECRYFENMALLDNRNYIIFYITHRLMHYLSDQALYVRVPDQLLWYPPISRKNRRLVRVLRESEMEDRNNQWK